MSDEDIWQRRCGVTPFLTAVACSRDVATQRRPWPVSWSTTRQHPQCPTLLPSWYIAVSSSSRVVLTSYHLPQYLMMLPRTWMRTLCLQRPTLLLRQSWSRAHQQCPTLPLRQRWSTSHQQRLTLLLLPSWSTSYQLPQCLALLLRPWMSALRLRLQATLFLHLSLGTSRLRQLGTQHQQLSLSTLRLCLQRTQCMLHQP